MTDKEPLSRPAEEPSNGPEPSAGQAGTPDVPPQDAAPPVPTPEGEAGGANPEQEHTYPSIFDKPDHTNRKQAKERKLSRGARNVILTLVLCVALAGSVFGIYRFLPKQEEENTSSSGMTLSLFDYSQYVTYDSSLTESEGVKNILVTNPTGSYEVVYSIVEKTQTNSVTGEEETGPAIEWSIAGQEGVRFDSDTIQYLVGDLLKVIYTTVYNTDANALNAEGITLRQECGFDNPTATMTVNFNDGKTYTIYLGSELPTGGSYYLMQSGDDTIYVAEDIDVSYFLRGISYYVSQQMVPMLEESDADSSYFADGLLNRFDEITISGRNFAQPIVLEMADSSQIAVPTDYRMTSPVQQAADTDKVTTLLSPLANGLEATECLVMKATSDDIREYGLDSPIREVRYVVDGETYVLKVGNQVQEGILRGLFQRHSEHLSGRRIVGFLCLYPGG